MSTLPMSLRYSVSVTVADGLIDDPPVWGFSSGYDLAYIKDRVGVHLRELGYELVRLRQELTPEVSIEVRSQPLFEQIVKRALRLEQNPLIELIAYVRELPRKNVLQIHLLEHTS